MAKDWMFKGLTGDVTPEDEINTCINQGKFMVEIAEKIKKNEPLTEIEREWAAGIVRARGKDQIINPTKYISKEENGAPPDPRRYEAVLRYYCYLKILKVPRRAIELVCYSYEDITSDNLKSWIKQEREAGQPIKRQADDMIINNPESIIDSYEKIKGKK
ncbi:hypothetical protein [Acinetobacter pittii]|uniref:hypothetical protein n=1 Tax=Acinetobacter pittii TaxID=48296 RepID=UPI000C7880FF|nr:hypothetical protein [Acinetobacter pittii]AUM25551.1 hypothetical protein BVD86_00845 [Acinetobacter pittii]